MLRYQKNQLINRCIGEQHDLIKDTERIRCTHLAFPPYQDSIHKFPWSDEVWFSNNTFHPFLFLADFEWGRTWISVLYVSPLCRVPWRYKIQLFNNTFNPFLFHADFKWLHFTLSLLILYANSLETVRYNFLIMSSILFFPLLSLNRNEIALKSQFM